MDGLHFRFLFAIRIAKKNSRQTNFFLDRSRFSIYTVYMLGFDWDAANIDHIARHGITPAQVEQVFRNPFEDKARTIRNGEERFIIAGRDDAGREIVVVWTWRAGKIRTVTARPVHTRR